jgi:hypothetical protein
MFDFSLNPAAKREVILVGQELTPIVVIDDFALKVNDHLCFAGNENEYSPSKQDHYPGVRKAVAENYGEHLCQLYFDLIRSTYHIDSSQQAQTILSAYSLTTTPAEQLTPIQMVPHLDSTIESQFAIVHYLCNKNHGGTSFYRHKKTNFERINTERLPIYAQIIKQQAMAAQLHKKPQYINSSTVLFEQVATIEAQMNRAIIYPSNLLHSANIQTNSGLSVDPKKGRLTISSFIQLS